jgi:hypothetical protein
MKYLGFIIFIRGIKVDLDKIAVIKDWRLLKIVKGI